MESLSGLLLPAIRYYISRTGDVGVWTDPKMYAYDDDIRLEFQGTSNQDHPAVANVLKISGLLDNINRLYNDIDMLFGDFRRRFPYHPHPSKFDPCHLYDIADLWTEISLEFKSISCPPIIDPIHQVAKDLVENFLSRVNTLGITWRVAGSGRLHSSVGNPNIIVHRLEFDIPSIYGVGTMGVIRHINKIYPYINGRLWENTQIKYFSDPWTAWLKLQRPSGLSITIDLDILFAYRDFGLLEDQVTLIHEIDSQY